MVSTDYTRINPAMDEHCEINVLLFDGLTDHDGDNQIIPRLAKSWEYDEENLTYTFHLEEGVKWHDGEPFTAEDVKFTFEAIMDPANESENAPDYEDIESIEVIDENTVAFHLSNVNTAFLEYMTRPVMPKHLLEGEDWQTSDFFRAPVGTGPYKFVSWDAGLVGKLLDTQDFDLFAVNSVKRPNHHRISAGAYANPFNKGCFVNKLDYVVLAALEVDTHFNCNVVVGSDGMITGAQGGHPDAAQGAKCTIVICPLLQGRIPAICTDVTTVTTPGESIDVVVTDYGVAVNPARQDLLKCLKEADCVPLKTIEELRDIAYDIVGTPQPVKFGERVVGIIEGRDGTIMDVVREVAE